MGRSNLAQIQGFRSELSDANTALRQAQDTLIVAKAKAEQRIIEAAGGEKELGANAEARARALTLNLQEDFDYLAAKSGVETLQATVDHLRAQLDNAKDEFKEWEITVRERLVDSLYGREAEDTVIDNAASGKGNGNGRL